MFLFFFFLTHGFYSNNNMQILPRQIETVVSQQETRGHQQHADDRNRSELICRVWKTPVVTHHTICRGNCGKFTHIEKKWTANDWKGLTPMPSYKWGLSRFSTCGEFGDRFTITCPAEVDDSSFLILTIDTTCSRNLPNLPNLPGCEALANFRSQTADLT